ncbi:DUF4347 domain-containing protein [Desulfogranum mediterraneum]|uniref:DUF4347 domain-containing protein n=1 Tax=Desulfogranum mediterraneum TaxID=160661 RepID=UPI00048ADE6E|nr:DUF4347 domain-containing protein [Desulfogranum mediterraneum]
MRSERFLFEPLEQRLLLSADMAPLAVTPPEDTSLDQAAETTSAFQGDVVLQDAGTPAATAEGEPPPLAGAEDAGEEQLPEAEAGLSGDEGADPAEPAEVLDQEAALDDEQDQALSEGAAAASGQAIAADAESPPAESEAGAPSQGQEAAASQVDELILVNDNLADHQQLADYLADSEDDTTRHEVILLDSSRPGIDQVSSILEGYSDVQAVHLFSHGDSGSVQLGSSWLYDETIDAYSEQLRAWGDSLTEQADILFYGCNLAADEQGRALTDRIAELTGADVAASEDASGHSLLAGDWELEYVQGRIEAESPLSAAGRAGWQHLLAEESIADDFNSGGYSGSSGSQPWAGDWTEIGDNSNGPSTGRIRVISGELRLKTADSEQSIRGISREADLSSATAVYLSYDYFALELEGSGEVLAQIRKDGGSWTTLREYKIDSIESGSEFFDVSDYVSAQTEIRFVSEGKDDGGGSDGNDHIFIDNIRLDYTTTSFETAFWLSTDGHPDGEGQPGTDTWRRGDLVRFANPNLTLEDGIDPANLSTNGTFAMGAELSTFINDKNISAMHYVSADQLLGASNLQLSAGDLILASRDASDFAGLAVEAQDVVLFHPDTPGDYSSGTFTMLLKNLSTKEIRAITLVEQDTRVGDTDLAAGDFLFSDDVGGEENLIRRFQTIDVGPTSTSGTVTDLLNGNAANVQLDEITGIDLVETTQTIGGRTINSGQILLTSKHDAVVGTNNLSVTKQDIFAISVAAGSGDVSASLFFEGDDLGLDEGKEALDALSLTSTNNTAPQASNLSAAETYTEDTPLNLTDIVITDSEGNQVSVTLSLSDSAAGSLSTATAGSVTSTFVDGVWSASGAQDDVNTLLSGVTFTPTLNYDSDFTIATRVDDGITPAQTGVKNITAIPENDAPTVTNLSTPETYTENQDLDLVNIVISDVDSATVSATLVLSDSAAGSLSIATVGSTSSSYDGASGTWSATGLLSEINELLAGVIFTPVAGYASDFTIQTSVDDATAPAVTGSKDMTASTVANNPPTASNLDTAEGYTEDVSLDLTDIVISDSDSPNVSARLTLSDTNAGGLTTATVGTVSSTYDAGTGVWSASGAIADVNALLAGVSFSPAENYTGNFSIATWVDDGVNPAIGGTKDFTPTAVDDPPTATGLDTAESYTEDTALDLSDIVISDVDSATLSASLTLSDPAAGSLSIASSGGVSSSFDPDSGVWSASGALADVNILLAGVSFSPSLNYDKDFRIDTRVEDATTVLSGAKDMIATAVNDAPAATNLSAAESYTEDTALDLSDIVISDVDSATLSATLTLSDPAAGSLSTGSSGGVSSTFDPGSGVWSASGALADVNTLLAGLVFTPSLNHDGDLSIATQVDDGLAPLLSGTIDLAATPVGDTPEVSSVSTDPTTQSDLIFVTPHADDGPEVTHFRVSAITNGSLFLADGTSELHNHDFITVAEGAAGLRFTPDAAVNGSFEVESSEDGVSVALQSGARVATVTVNSLAPLVVTSPEPVPDEGLAVVAESGLAPPTAVSITEPVVGEGDPLLIPGLPLKESLPEPLAHVGPSQSTPEETPEEGADPAEEVTAGELFQQGEMDQKRSLSRAELMGPAATAADFNLDLTFRQEIQQGLGAGDLEQVAAAVRRYDNELGRQDLDVEMNEVLALIYQKRSILEDQALRNSLDLLRDETTREARFERTVIGSAIAASTTLSAGYVIWMIRSGVLLSSLLSSMPAWQLADPLAILSRQRQAVDDGDPDDSLAGIINREKEKNRSSQRGEPGKGRDELQTGSRSGN